MYNSRNILVFLMLLSFQALATQLQPEPRNGFNDCGKVSFSEAGRNYNKTFSENEVSTHCYNIESDAPTAATIVLNSVGCKYRVKTFPLKCCGSNARLHHLDYRNRVVHLNRLPICSFSIDFIPDDETSIDVEFLESGGTSTYHVKQAKCYNICDGVSNFKYFDTVKLYHKTHIARGYYVNLFYKAGCSGRITNEDHEIAMETNGTLDLTTITQSHRALSYEIYS